MAPLASKRLSASCRTCRGRASSSSCRSTATGGGASAAEWLVAGPRRSQQLQRPAPARLQPAHHARAMAGTRQLQQSAQAASREEGARPHLAAVLPLQPHTNVSVDMRITGTPSHLATVLALQAGAALGQGARGVQLALVCLVLAALLPAALGHALALVAVVAVVVQALGLAGTGGVTTPLCGVARGEGGRRAREAGWRDGWPADSGRTAVIRSVLVQRCGNPV